MTFCLGVSVDEGLIAIADTLITSGREMITAKKLTTYQPNGGAMFVMTSGLRSVRDKALTYFENSIADRDEPFDRLFEVVNLFAEHLRQVRREDLKWLKEDGLSFNTHVLIGGQMRHDQTHKLYLVYPEGNWVEPSRATPYQVIGSTGYGKPILDRTLKANDSMRHAFKVGCLAFDSTRISAADVDFPIDAAVYKKDSFRVVEHRFGDEDLQKLSARWQERIRSAIKDVPSEFDEKIFSKLDT